MKFTNDFFIEAQLICENIFRSYQKELIQKNGNIAIEIKADKSVVTELDKKIESDLKAALQKFDAGIGIEGEESGIQGSRQTFWLIDPIDGTEAFTRGLPFFRNMVSLIDNGQPVFALVYRPVFDELFVAADGEGTYKNGVPVHVSTRAVSESRIEIHSPKNLPSTWHMMESVANHISGIRVMGEFTYVADGSLDGLIVFEGGGGPWDFAPRALLIKEAGGLVTNIGSTQYDYQKNSMLAANPIIFDEIMNLLTVASA